MVTEKGRFVKSTPPPTHTHVHTYTVLALLHTHTTVCYCLFLKCELASNSFSELVNDCSNVALPRGQCETPCAFSVSFSGRCCCIDGLYRSLISAGIESDAIICYEIKERNMWDFL